ncbi:hypothetical protein ABT215_24310 [Streptomyces sp900105755]|uniref:hypothetical protein n=1 Tax=Streptomyces sp. 900105755 TaxID=3154389 RepID=UPI00332F15F2
MTTAHTVCGVLLTTVIRRFPAGAVAGCPAWPVAAGAVRVFAGTEADGLGRPDAAGDALRLDDGDGDGDGGEAGAVSDGPEGRAAAVRRSGCAVGVPTGVHTP